MTILNAQYNVPENSGITVEDDEDMVYIKHNNEVKAVYRYPSEAMLKEGIAKVIKETAQEKEKGKNLAGVLD